MTPAFKARRAEEFHRLVEAPSAGGRGHSHVARDADLLGVVTAMREAPAPEARPQFVADLRSRLMVAAQSALAPDTAEQAAARRRVPARTKKERRIAIAVGGFAIVSATTSMAVAAQSALPGDTLYPLKRAIENAQVSVQSDGEGKGSTLLDNASGRLDEVDELSRGEGDSHDISATLDDFASQAREASDLLLNDYLEHGRVSSLEELRAFTAKSMEQLAALQDLVPAGARAALIKAAQVLSQIDQLAVQACPSCTASPVTQAPTFSTSSLIDPLTRIISVAVPGAGNHQSVKANRLAQAHQPSAPSDTTQPGRDATDKGTSPPSPPRLSTRGTKHADPTRHGAGPIGDLLQGLTGTHPDGTATSRGAHRNGRHHGLDDVLDDTTHPLGDVLDGLAGR